MGFKSQQNPFGLETVNEFTERMRMTIKEVKSMICKAQDNMKRYYDRRKTLALVFNLGDKVFLDASDIRTTRPSQKLSHWQLGPFVVEWRIGPMVYHLKLVRGQPWDRLDNLVGFISTSVPTDSQSPWSIVPFSLVRVSIIVLHSYIW